MFTRRLVLFTIRNYCQRVPQPLRSVKPKSSTKTAQNFLDLKQIRVQGGKGGDGCISFLHLWSNEYAGPDGGDGGNGGHVILKSSKNVQDLAHVESNLQAEDGERGYNKDCNGKSAEHLIINVPIGTVIKNENGVVVGDLSKEGLMFVAARGGAGGKGNHFFATDVEQTPKICEYGAQGESLEYSIEMRSMAHVGLIGFPNAGKSTLLQAISRAKPKIAPYPFTTLKPHIGMILYDDYEQIAVADLPGLIPDSHKNKGLGIQFLRHAERCACLLFVIDASLDEPWKYLETLHFELSQFSPKLIERPQIIVANKMDLPEAQENIDKLKESSKSLVIPVSAKTGTNLTELLNEIRKIYDVQMKETT